MRWEINSKDLTAETIRQFKVQAAKAGMTHGEWLTELVTAQEGGKG